MFNIEKKITFQNTHIVLREAPMTYQMLPPIQTLQSWG